MDNEWWLLVLSVAWLISLIWTRNMAYRHGIWDGAFNHFLPVVRREMLFYDADRARRILLAERETGDE
ncbi:MAG: hypothetical protein KGL35_28230 [Bradyrhizobium sp.]|nr:hypothetical protein [Bradyrhizobium sp.]